MTKAIGIATCAEPAKPSMNYCALALHRYSLRFCSLPVVAVHKRLKTRVAGTW